jgi:hypothetical protein
MSKKKTPLDLRISMLESVRNDFKAWAYDDTSDEQHTLVCEAVHNIDLAIAHMKAFRALQ